MKLTNKVYNGIKYTITIFLPAVGTLYFLLAQTWGFERISGVNGTINALITFGGLLIGYSSRKYNRTVNAPDGDLIVQEVDGEKYIGLGVNTPTIEELTSKDQVKLNVIDKTATDPRMHIPPGVPTVLPGATPVNPATSRFPHPPEG